MGDSISPDPHTIIVSTEYGDVTVHKMPLSDYGQVLRALDKLPKQFTEIFGDMSDDKLKDMSSMDFVALLPAILAEAWPDIVSIVSVPTDKDAEFLGKLDFADSVDILSAILELNDVQRIMAAIKKVVALRAKVTRPQKKQK